MDYLYEKKDRNLILLSNIIESYPSLKQFLRDYARPTIKDLHKAPKDVQNIFKSKLFAELTLQARAEWRLVSDHPTVILDYLLNPHECEYCGKKHLKFVYIIENQANGTRLNIGSTCIVDLGIKSKKEMADYDKRAKRFYRQTLLAEHIPEIIVIMDSLMKPLERSSIIIPQSLQEKFLNSVRIVKERYNEFLDLKTPEKDLSFVLGRLQKALAYHDHILNELGNYISENKEKLLVCKKEYLQFFRHDAEVDNDVRKSGFVNKKALLHITDSVFMASLIPSINSILASCSITVNGVKRTSYQFSYTERRELFLIDHTSLMDLIVERIFDEPLPHALTVNGILAISNFADERSYLTGVRFFIGDTKYDCELYLDKNEIIFFDEEKRDKLLSYRGDKPNAILHRWSDFYRRFSRNMLIREDVPRRQLADHIYKNGDHIVYTQHQGMVHDMERNPAKHS